MRKTFWTPARISGAALLLGLAVTMLGFVVILAQGKINAFPAMWNGVESVGAATSGFRTLEAFRAPATVLLLLSVGVLTVYLAEAGDRLLPFLALATFVVFLVLSVVEAAFHASVTAWAGEEWGRTGTLPSLYEPLRLWVNGPLQLTGNLFGLTAFALYGWSMLRTSIVPRWVGLAVTGWSTLWLVGILAMRDTLPAVYFTALMLFLGLALVFSKEGLVQRRPERTGDV